MAEKIDPLFIVDNSEGAQNGIDYLREWCKIASTFDIATGYFDIGALTALEGEWQKLEGMRILMEMCWNHKKILHKIIIR